MSSNIEKYLQSHIFGPKYIAYGNPSTFIDVCNISKVRWKKGRVWNPTFPDDIRYRDILIIHYKDGDPCTYVSEKDFKSDGFFESLFFKSKYKCGVDLLDIMKKYD